MVSHSSNNNICVGMRLKLALGVSMSTFEKLSAGDAKLFACLRLAYQLAARPESTKSRGCFSLSLARAFCIGVYACALRSARRALHPQYFLCGVLAADNLVRPQRDAHTGLLRYQTRKKRASDALAACSLILFLILKYNLVKDLCAQECTCSAERVFIRSPIWRNISLQILLF